VPFGCFHGGYAIDEELVDFEEALFYCYCIGHGLDFETHSMKKVMRGAMIAER
jgi:hypothetical protein